MNQYRTRLLSLLALIALLASITVLISQAAATSADRQDSDWYYNDHPRREGPQDSWWPRTSGGWNGDYHFTYGIGNDTMPVNWAVWDMGHRHGRQTIHVWIPRAPADVRANVLYRIYKNDSLIDSVRVDQNISKKWQRLGAWNFNGADVRVEAWDNETLEHYDRNDPSESRFGIDTAAMRCWSRCWDDSEQLDARPISVPDKDDYISRVNEFHARGFLCNQDGSTHPYNVEKRTGVDTPWVPDQWNFYVGECTSWVAFRLQHEGIAFHNQAGGNLPDTPSPARSNRWSHAKYWDDRGRVWNEEARQSSGFDVLVNDTPAVGAVAQWESGYGHVAYVEEVKDNGNVIVVSEMNYGNYYSDFVNTWRREWCKFSRREIRRGSSQWPGDFIHISIV